MDALRYILKTVLLLGLVLSTGHVSCQEANDATHDSPGQLDSLSVAQFTKITTSATKLVLVNFSADWCVLCKKQKPVLEELKAYYKDSLKVVEIDMENNPQIAAYFEVDALPVNLLYKKGEMVWNTVGLQSKTNLMNAIWLYRFKNKKTE